MIRFPPSKSGPAGTTSTSSSLMALLAIGITLAGGCGGSGSKAAMSAGDIRLTPLRDEGTAQPDAISLSAAGNEWVSFTLQLSNLTGADRSDLSIRLTPLVSTTTGVPVVEVAAYQLVDMPMQSGHADFVRHVGQSAGDVSLGRALIPLPAVAGEPTRFSLAALRSSAFADGPASVPADNVRLWVDLRPLRGTVGGSYAGALELVAGKGAGKVTVSAPLNLTVHNFTIPEQRAMKVVGRVDWNALIRHYEGDFEAVTPRKLNRSDEKYAVTVRRLDSLMSLAQQHRLSLVYPDLQPSVKWPANINNAPPDIFWEDFDAVVTPWLSGQAFSDGMSIAHWPLPEAEQLLSLDARSRLSYWEQCASHFDHRDWLDFSSVSLRKVAGGRPSGAEVIEMSMEAARLLASHPRISVSTPLEDGQVQVADPKRPNVIGGVDRVDPIHVRRLRTAVAGPIAWKQDWPAGVEEPRHWLRTDLPDVVSITGAGGEERDIRQWAWLAFLRKADQILFAQALPNQKSPRSLADPAELVWFYPGEWFGLNEPVPTVQLKWLRAAEQDYEYLHLARSRGEMLNALWMARLLTKPVEIGLGQSPDPSYSLMTGTADERAWTEARRLLVKLIDLRAAGEVDAAAQGALEVEILQWARPQERPLLIGRSTEWTWKRRSDGRAWINLGLGLDIYNASDIAPGDNQLLWTSVPPGFERRPEPMPVPRLDPFRVIRGGLIANVDPEKVSAAARQPLELELAVDSPTVKFISPLKVALPVAITDRREGRFSFDGRLDDWIDADKIHDGPLVKMLSRPAVLAQAMEPAATPSRVYTNWAAENFYVGFAVAGLSRPDQAGGGFRNFVEYQARRAWGEDLIQVLVQPVYADNALGPILHVVCKPNGSNWVERKLDPRLNADPWESIGDSGARYAAHLAGDQWTGELAIPWKVLDSKEHGRPTLLRFNFVQHRNAFGESASWAGPIDFGRDDSLTGLLVLKFPLPGQPGDAVRGLPGTEVPGVIER